MLETRGTSKLLVLPVCLVVFLLLVLGASAQDIEAQPDCEGKISGYTLIDLDRDSKRSDSDFFISGVQIRLSPEDINYPDVFVTSDMNGYWGAAVCSDVYTVTVESSSVDSKFELTTPNRKLVRISPTRPGQTHIIFFFDGDVPKPQILGATSSNQPNGHTSFILVTIFIGGLLIGVNAYVFLSKREQQSAIEHVPLA